MQPYYCHFSFITLMRKKNQFLEKPLSCGVHFLFYYFSHLLFYCYCLQCYICLHLLFLLPTSTQHPPPFCSGHHQAVVCIYGLCLYIIWLTPSPSFIQFPCPLPSDSCQSVLYIHAHFPHFCVGFLCICQFPLTSQRCALR